MRLLVTAFHEAHPDINVEVRTVGSTNGIWLAASGAVPVGLVSRPLRDTEQQLGLTVLPYARTALVLGVHPSVGEDRITSDQLLAIYRGGETRWRGGQRVALLTRERGDSDVQVLSRAMPGFDRAYAEGVRAQHATVLYSERQMVGALATRLYALGLTDLGTLTTERLSIRVLALNGVAPTVEAVARGSYPLVKTLAFVFKPERLTDEARALLGFVRSPENMRLLREHGYVPVE
jgi:phosphate transport system substrate-binding protein